MTDNIKLSYVPDDCPGCGSKDIEHDKDDIWWCLMCGITITAEPYEKEA